MMSRPLATLLLIFAFHSFARAQTVTVIPSPKVLLPTHIDGNSPSFWSESQFFLFSSTGNPEMISSAPSQFGPWQSQQVTMTYPDNYPIWIESAWKDEDGTIFGWYHHEPGGVCGSKPLTAPKIGAVVSYDGGKTVKDLGIVLETGDALDCNSQNGFFAGGHGDFSVVLDQEKNFFYFFFGNYGGSVSEQGIVTARLAFDDRLHPSGAVKKYYQGAWDEPGIGGHMTPIFPAVKSWQRSDTDSYWGPSVHWNTFLSRYVMLLNRSCCKSGWPQEGIYLSFGSDPANPSSWASANKIIDGAAIGYRPGYYPQVIGLGTDETDSVAGQRARLYIHGSSAWELQFAAPVAPSSDRRRPRKRSDTTIGVFEPAPAP